jgi:hypothetical protein
MQGGMFDFPHGHTTGFMNLAEPEKRPIWPQLDEIRSRVGDVKAQWMLKQRNAVFFPNLQIADQVVPILRTFRPIRVDLTELRSFVIAPVGEAPELRAWRLRQFEDVINPGGYATPDDIAVFEDCQSGYRASGFDWLQGYERGMAVVKREGNDMSAEMGVRPLESVYGPLDMHNEVALHAPLREWVRLMEAGLAGKPAY